MALDPDMEADLLRLFALVETGAPVPIPDDGSYKIVGGETSELLFAGEAYRVLGQIMERLARSSLAEGGRHESEVEALVISACRLARVDGHDDPVGWLAEQLDAPLRWWIVGRPFAAHLPCEELRIGRCRIRKDLPADLSREFVLTGLGEELRSAVILTEVEAFDRNSAYSRAAELFAEARAVAALLSSPTTTPSSGPYFTIDSDGVPSLSHGHARETLLVVRRCDSEGQLWPGYAELAAAAERTPEERTDWERRTLGAARWWYSAATQIWPSGALVAAISAVEALMSFPGEKTGKDKKVAARLVDGKARVRGVEDVGSWFRELHGRWRNNAAHDARFYLEDREVERLVDLAEGLVRWALGHLDPNHRSPYGACTTIKEAHRKPHDED